MRLPLLLEEVCGSLMSDENIFGGLVSLGDKSSNLSHGRGVSEKMDFRTSLGSSAVGGVETGVT